METKTENGHALKELLKTMISVIEERDVYIKGHSERVAATCVRFAGKLGLDRQVIEKIYLAALLHDIGMVYIPGEIVQKKGELNEDEMLVIKQHPIISEKILSKNTIFKGILPIIRHHHEAFDGSGYPDGLKGDEIPVESGILGLVNGYEAMISARPHRPSMTPKEALHEIKENSGTLYEKTLADAFVEFLGNSADVPADSTTHKGNGTVHEIIMGIVKEAKKGKIDLPVLPKIVQGIQSVMAQPNATVDDVADVIERDGVISVRLIAIANSPMYRGAEKINTVKQAIPRLGVKETQSVVTAIANKSLYQTNHEQFRVLMEKLWLHSLACAYASRIIAQDLGVADIEKLFLMGLIHDIGKPPLIKILTEMAPSHDAFKTEDVISNLAEFHTSFGGALLKRWGFNQDFNRVAMRHDSPNFSTNTEEDILIVHLANKLVKHLGYNLSGNGELEPAGIESAKLLGIDSEALDRIGEVTLQMMHETGDIF